MIAIEATTCPAPKDLQRLLLGLMPDDEAVVLVRHIKQCDRCLNGMQTLDAQDTMVVALRESRGRPEGPVAHGLEEVNESVPGLQLPVKRVTETVDLPKPAPTPVVRSAAIPQHGPQFLAPPEAPDEIGRLGPYRIFSTLGSGACGVVFKAEDVNLRRTVALKAMKPEGGASDVSRQRFLREARAVAGIEHENIVTVYQVGEDHGVPYLAMQLLRGETLDDRLQREGKLPIREAVRIGKEIAEGLAAAHERGLVHRDVKPANIWIEAGKGRVKIVDFGLARAASDDTHLTRTGTVVGTPAYMAPEQARAAPVDHRCDLFSLGCVLYRMVGGQTPISAPDTMSMLLALAYEQPRPLNALNEETPAELVVLVTRLLAKHPDGRPAETATVAEALAMLEKDLEQKTTTPVAARASSEGFGQRWLGTVAALMVLIVLGLAGYLYGPQLMLMARDRGMLRVRSNDPAVLVNVKQNGQVIHARTALRELELVPGPYEIELAEGRAGMVSPPRFYIERGETTLVTVAGEKKTAK